ncbi:IclR family transcriptional regulator [Paratissierella segnis]|jgi:DNA-binding IclR family transcriptional regulator|uniref:IclR family transcriptional regulator n=1 Tax=Paratissierella segnis TaxID=2763679 RepID=A0A926EWR3_9FIRM|nr:IclR family transcriptional regulator [Paratissierella segnis]MBC8588947.1 IclR family transcriptional regulator [Paratissierella segnis]
MEEQYNIRSIERALNILKCFNENRTEIGLLEFAEMLSLNKSTVFRILTNLNNCGFVDVNAEGKYILGSEIIRLGNIRHENDLLKAEAIKILNELQTLTNETVILIRYNNYKATCIDKIESSNDLKIVSEIGRNIPMLKGASGKVIAAHLSESELERCFAIQQNLFNYRDDLNILKDEFKTIRENGYCLTTSEVDAGVTAFAVPIFGAAGSVIGSVSIAGPNFRFNDEVIISIKDRVLNRIYKLSQKMGYKQVQA